MLLTDKYADKICGIITCYDRMIIQGYIPNWSHAEAMTAYMKLNGIRIFDYPSFSQLLTEQVRQNAEMITQENGVQLNSSASFMPSAKMTVSSRSYPKQGRRKAWSISFLPWNVAILINHGMIKRRGRHS